MRGSKIWCNDVFHIGGSDLHLPLDEIPARLKIATQPVVWYSDTSRSSLIPVSVEPHLYQGTSLV